MPNKDIGGEKWGIVGMFVGQYTYSLDQKGRVVVPSKYRQKLGDSFIITRGLDKCVFIYPMEEWNALSERLEQLPFTKKDVRSFVRMFFSGAVEVSTDSQGRISLPPFLREYAGISKDVVFLGVGNRIELWSKEIWGVYEKDSSELFEKIAEEIGI